jgi:hypothetical protein
VREVKRKVEECIPIGHDLQSTRRSHGWFLWSILQSICWAPSFPVLRVGFGLESLTVTMVNIQHESTYIMRDAAFWMDE